MWKLTRIRRIAGAMLIAGAAIGAYRLGGGWRARPNVILIVLDTFRADRVGAYGNAQGLTSFLDRWAAHSTVYERAYATSAWTIPSIASLLLAQYPSEHQMTNYPTVLPANTRTLPVVLRAHGFSTAAFSGNMQIATDQGFGQGFDTFQLILGPQLKGDAADINRGALAWLDQRRARDRPFFLYLQYMDTHGPYIEYRGLTDPRPPELRASDSDLNGRLNDGSVAAVLGNREPWHFEPAELHRLLDLYDGAVKYLDRCLGELLGSLERANLLADSLVIITADHGEEFGEHGMFAHGVSLHESSIHVPLIVRFPGQTLARRLAYPVELAGLAPALLQQLDIPEPSEFHVAALPFGERAATRAVNPIFSELIETRPNDFRLHRYALIDGMHKLLVTQDGEYVYEDLTADPHENHALSAAPFGDRLRQGLVAVTSALNAVPGVRQAAPLDDQTRQRLHALGYAN